MSLKKLLWLLPWLVSAATPLLAASISGTVNDFQTGAPIPGVYIKIAGTNLAALSDTAGNFSFAEAPPGSLKLIASAIGYEVAVERMEHAGPANIALIPKILRGQDVVVTASRARKGETPAAFSNLTNADIGRQYWSQDVPVLLSSLPNVYAYSDAGSGIGYSYMKMRGFDQKRVAVMLNGIPLNDADSHELFWVDLPDFAASAEDIQVQRGVGSSLYGASALGGSINIVTGGFAPSPRINFESGYGSYNTKKLSLSGNSGLVNDNYAFYGRYSRIETEGYRNDSWTKSYAYFIGMARFDDKMTWKFNTYGGPEESHLAYKGITKEMLDSNRRYNELEFDGEIDHFNQPHYELLHDWKLGQSWNLSNTFYYFNGDGYYTQQRARRDVEEYFPGYFGIDVADTLLAPRDYYALDDSGAFEIEDGHYTISKADLIKRPTVNEYDWGWIPRATYSYRRMELTLGGEVRIHNAHHFGEVVWASIYPAGLSPQIRYYDYRGKSRTASAYVLETIHLSERLSLLANIQYQRHTYELYGDKRFAIGFDRTFDYLSPRGGVNFRFSPAFDLFASVSTSSRHPAFKDIYDPTDYWSNPSYKPDNFRAAGAGWGYIGKEIKPERLLDFELGSNFNTRLESITLKGAVNLYRMQITDEILPYAGQIDDMGYPISGNADKSIHQGVEFSFDAAVPANLILSGNISVNDDHFEKYVEYGFDYENWVALEFDRSGKRIGGFPEAIGNYRIRWMSHDFEIGLNGSYIGQQYIDNGQSYKLDSYNLLGAVVTYDLGRISGFRSLQITGRINNLANKKYVASAYMEPDDNLPRYIVGAERNAYLSLKASF